MGIEIVSNPADWGQGDHPEASFAWLVAMTRRKEGEAGR